MVIKLKDVNSNVVEKTKKSNLKKGNVMKHCKKEKAVVCCIVSSKWQEDNFSLDVQERLATKYAEEHNLEIVSKIKCIESSWCKNERQCFLNMLKYIDNHSKIKHIIFFSQETLSKNDFNKLKIQELVEQKGKTIHFVIDKKVYDKQSFYRYKLIQNMEDFIEDMFSDIISKTTMIKLKQKVEDDIYPSTAAFSNRKNKLQRAREV